MPSASRSLLAALFALSRLRTTQQTAAQRKRMESAVELLIAALDALDVTVEDIEDDDPGEEPGDEEPSLGWTYAEARKGVPFQGPSYSTDLEDEHDGREPDEDQEPSLGAFEQLTDRRHSWKHSAYWSEGDREEDPAESGIGIEGGRTE